MSAGTAPTNADGTARSRSTNALLDAAELLPMIPEPFGSATVAFVAEKIVTNNDSLASLSLSPLTVMTMRSLVAPTGT
jgi:hypothetical protein